MFQRDEDIPVDPETGMDNWDCVEALNFDAFVHEIKHLKATGELSPQSATSMYKSETDDQAHPQVSNELLKGLSLKLNQLLHGRKLIIVDGFMLFHDPSIIELFDLRIFVKCPRDTLQKRREHRSYNTVETTWTDPPGYFEKVVYPAYAKSHSYLFINGDVESHIDPSMLKRFSMLSVENDKDTHINDVLEDVGEWLVEQLQET